VLLCFALLGSRQRIEMFSNPGVCGVCPPSEWLKCRNEEKGYHGVKLSERVGREAR